jgi:predicted secreted protein
MVAITPLRGTQLYIKVGDGATPTEIFTHPCLINAKRGIAFKSTSNKVIIPDCDNPEDPAWSEAIKDALSATIDGAGVLDNVAETISFYDAWFRDVAAKNVQVWLGTDGHWEGKFDLNDWGITGDRGGNAEVTITLESNGILGPYVPAV